MARQFAEPFGAGDWAETAGIWHDLGKYRPDFQRYIRKSSGYNADAHLENTPGKVDHSSAGAIHAMERHPLLGKILAYLIAGHHSGLPDWEGRNQGGRSLRERLDVTNELEKLHEARAGGAPETILNQALPKSIPVQDPDQAHLWIRMLFSALVDADFLDTEAFMDPERSAQRLASKLTLQELEVRLSTWTAMRDADLESNGRSNSVINLVRRQVLQQCLNAAELEPGFFTLSVPTGGGKTLSSLAFGLRHAIQRKKDRVIFCVPFTSIIEQTAETYRTILGSEAVLEHHSSLDPGRETPLGRLATENWDAPLVVTTNVQLFESLFAHRTSRCRKLHRIANSVIILDEAQTLPPSLLMPTLTVLKGLVTHFGCTVVMCTATQPALTGKFTSGQVPFQGIDSSIVREIVEDPVALASQLKRVEIEWQDAVSGQATEFADLADRLATHRQVLCIVNRRQDCRELFEALRDRCTDMPFHLSALMCANHRSDVIAQIKRELAKGATVRVVSTQLVEAGVDLDFPIVFRAMAGLDSIAQAAGRCNREGRLNERAELGKVVVFRPPQESPPGILRKGEQACASMLRAFPQLCQSLSPEAFEHYFRMFFSQVNDLGAQDFKSLLAIGASRAEFQFKSASAWYQLIDDQGRKDVVVDYQDTTNDLSIIGRLLDDIRQFGPSSQRLRQLQRFTVSIPTRVWNHLKDISAIIELAGPEGPLGLWAQCSPGLYDPVFGLRVEGPELTGMEFIA